MNQRSLNIFTFAALSRALPATMSKFYAGDKPTGAETRKAFVDYFCQKNQHVNIVSSATIPHNDPTLLFANAGMNQVRAICRHTPAEWRSSSRFSWAPSTPTATLAS